MGTVDRGNITSSVNQTERPNLLVRFCLAVQNTNASDVGLENRRCAWAPDGSYLAWSCGKKTVKLIPWNSIKNCPLTDDDTNESGKNICHQRTIRSFDAGDLICSLAFGTKDGSRNNNEKRRPSWYTYKDIQDLLLVVGLRGGNIRTYNVRTGQIYLVLMDHTNIVQDLQFAPDFSLRLLSASRDGSLKLWHLDDDGNMSNTFKGKVTRNMRACAWNPDCQTVCGVGDFRGVHLWNIKTGKYQQLHGHHNDVSCCVFSPDGILLVTSSYDTMVIIWNSTTGEQLSNLFHVYPPPRPWQVGGSNNSYVRHLSFSAGGRHISTICQDGSMRLWDVLRPAAAQCIVDAPQGLCCNFSPGGGAVAVGDRKGTLTVWSSPRDFNLQHLCRVSIQRNLTVKGVSDTQKEVMIKSLPHNLQLFLQYEDIKLNTDN